MRFVYGYLRLGDNDVVLRSRELRLMKGSWSIDKLKTYASMANMKITDWSVFEKALKVATDKVLRDARAAFKAA
jgi:hypothetical protein